MNLRKLRGFYRIFRAGGCNRWESLRSAVRMVLA